MRKFAILAVCFLGLAIQTSPAGATAETNVGDDTEAGIVSRCRTTNTPSCCAAAGGNWSSSLGRCIFS